MEVSRSDVSSTELQHFSEEDRFLKMSIDNYMDLREFEPVPPQIAMINAIQNPLYRFIVACLSRRTGKTEISNMIAHLVTLNPGSQVLLIAPNYALSSISWDLQRKFLNMFDVELERSNAKDRVLELANGSTVRMGSVSQVNSVVGRSYDLIIFDEAALNDQGASAFNIQLMPTLDKKNSKVIFVSTPRGKNWFYDFYMRGFDKDIPNACNKKFDGWVSIKSSWSDNPRVKKETVEQARMSMSEAEFKQEFEGDFVALQGAIFTLREQHVIDVDRSEIDVWECIAGLDVGFRDPTAFAVILSDGHNFYIVDEAQFIPKSTSEVAEMIHGKLDRHMVDFTYIDSSAAQMRLDLAHEHDISTINAKKDVLPGIGYVQSLLEHDRLFIDRSCEEAISALTNYQWDTKEGLIRERPLHNDYSHMADAIRYALYSHSYNVDPIGDMDG